MAKDPYRYFRIEAQELVDGLSSGLLTLERDAGPETMGVVLRHAHTFKGAARVVKQSAIADFAHALEDLLAPFRDDGIVPAGVIGEALTIVDEIRGLLEQLDAPLTVTEEPSPQPPRGDDGSHSVRIRVSDLDQLLRAVHAASTVVERLVGDDHDRRELLHRAEAIRRLALRHGADPVIAASETLVTALKTSARHLGQLGDELQQELTTARDVATEMRLVSAEVLLSELERTVRDAAAELGRELEFRQSGSDVRLDAAVLNELRGALRHAVRNAVAHGIEPRAERIRAGKSPTGVVSVSVRREGPRVVVTCRDDGRGLVLEDLHRIAHERGLLAERTDRRVDADELIGLILNGGLSTAGRVNQIAGRGLGLDAVRAAAERLQGEVRVESQPGEGTTVTLVVPISLASLPALSVEVGGEPLLVPLDSVAEVMKLRDRDIVASAEGNRLAWGDQVIPFVSLGDVFAPSDRALAPDAVAVVIRSGGAAVAAGVQRVCGVRSVVVESLPNHIRAHAHVGGAAVDELGIPRLVVAPTTLAQLTAETGRRPRAREQSPARLPLLVIDDSLTTRMLEQSILEAAGYEVDLAVSGEEGLHLARERHYAAFVVDVEMPGMSGFDFVATTQADAALSAIPSILVTSLDDAAHKARGLQVGARAYIVKGRFDQRELLDTIRRLTEET